MKNKRYFSFFLVALFIVFGLGVLFIYQDHVASSDGLDNEMLAEENIEAEVIIPDKKVIIPISSGSSFGELMTSAGVGASLVQEVYNACLDVYDLAKIKSGHEIELTYDKDSDELKSLLYKIDSEEEVFVSCSDNDGDNINSTSTDIIADEEIWKAEKRKIPYEVKTVVKEATVESSVYQAALDNDIDERAIIELANAFQWSLDFAMDSRKGDTFKFVYEERYLNGEYVMPGQILAGKYVNDGHEFYVYYFEENEDNMGYFDQDGNSVQKMFLKAPVAFKYISSGYTTGLRYVEAFNVSTGHRAIDYAAAYGTPIRAVGDGTVSMARYNGAYGNMVSIRHNGTYSTNYAHLSKFAVSYGTKVKQGDVIGYVGSTGFSTGPHLHYEMIKNGVKINPLHEILPPGEPIKEENRERFFTQISNWQEMLK